VCTAFIGANFFRKVGGSYGKRRARAYIEGLGAELPAGCRVRGSGGEASPAEAEGILIFTSANEAQICPFLFSCNLLKYTF